MTLDRVTRGCDAVRALVGTALLVVVFGTGSAGAAQNTVDHVTRGDMGLTSTGAQVRTVPHPGACSSRLGWRIGVLPY